MISEIPEIVARLRSSFDSGKTRPVAFRIQQLKNLYWLIHENEDALCHTLYLDLHRPKAECFLLEIDFLKTELLHIIRHVKSWTKDSPLSVPMALQFNSFRSQMVPLGEVLIISPWNFPIMLGLSPLAGAMAAGCTAVLKTSEISHFTSTLLAKLASQYLDSSCYHVINGDADVATKLLAEKFDKILFTGGGRVARIVAKAAAENLTPVVLELGGKCPAIVTKHADIKLAARRTMWGKVICCGQVCLAPDYVAIDESVHDEFIAECKAALTSFYSNGPEEENFGRLVNSHHFERVKDMLNRTRGKVVHGGCTNATDLYIDPTIVTGVYAEDSLMQDEIFGPILPVVSFANTDSIVNYVNRNHPSPLAIYIFSTAKAEEKWILERVPSGGAGINDILIHSTTPLVPFGGIGSSGTGCYRAKATFDTFTHRRTVAKSPGWMEFLLSFRYPPYTPAKIQRFRLMLGDSPWFDRQGKTRRWYSLWVTLLVAALFKFVTRRNS